MQVLNSGEWLEVGEWLESANGAFSLILQEDGNVVIYDWHGVPLWASNAFSDKPNALSMQEDGNLVAYDDDGQAYWATKTRNAGSYLIMQDDGNAVVENGDGPSWASGSVQEDVELPPQPPVASFSLHGPLVVDHEGWKDQTGNVNPIFCHAGDLFMQWCEGEKEKVRRALDKMVMAGYQGVRVWVPLVWRPENSSFWGNRSCSPLSVAGFYDELEAFFREMIARKLIIYPANGGLSGAANSEEEDYCHKLADLMGKLGPEWFFQPMETNEVRDTGDRDDVNPAELERLVNIIRHRFPQLTYALSAYTGDTTQEQARLYTPSWMNHVYFHGYRGGHYWDKIRHMFSNGYENYRPIRKYAFVGEDVGPGPLVSVTVNKHELDDAVMALIGTMAIVAGIGYTFISSPGIILNEEIDQYAGFYSVPRMIHKLPKDVMRFETLHHSGTTFRHERFFEARGETRVDGRICHDGRFVYVIYGPERHMGLVVNRSCEFDVYEPSTGEIIAHHRLNRGEVFDVQYNAGVVLIGREV